MENETVSGEIGSENSSPEFVLPDDLTAADQGVVVSEGEPEAEGELVDAEFTVTPDEVPKLDPRTEMARQIDELKAEVADQAVEVMRRDGLLKFAKKELSVMVEELRDLKSRFERGDYGLCFDPAKSAGDPAAGDAGDAGGSKAPLPGQKTLPLYGDGEDESWRSAPISDLGLTGKLPESLEDAGIRTIGDLADYTAAGKLLTDISGIGRGKAEKIEKACEEFWERHGRKSEEQRIEEGPTGNQAAIDAGAETDEEITEYAKGAAFFLEGHGPESNPHKKGSRLWQMFDRGWQEANAV